jgi:hypothetical protein
MTPTKKSLMKKEIERLENTSIAVFGMMDDAAVACDSSGTCSCLVTGFICCNDSTNCFVSVSFVVCDEPTTESQS